MHIRGFLSFGADRGRLCVMADDRWRVVRLARGKSEHHTAACRVENAGATVAKLRRRKVSQKRYRRFFEKSAGKGEKAR